MISDLKLRMGVIFTIALIIGLLNGCGGNDHSPLMPSIEVTVSEEKVNETTSKSPSNHAANASDHVGAAATNNPADMSASNEPLKEQLGISSQDGVRQEASERSSIDKVRGTKDSSITTSSSPSSQQPASAARIEASEPSMDEQTTVTLTITGDEETGVILSSTKVEIEEGDTVFDVLVKAVKEHDIRIEYSGRGSNTYIEGIDDLYEFDNGPTSGWVVGVNGTLIPKSSGAVEVEPRDQVEWFYTLNLGKDFKEAE